MRAKKTAIALLTLGAWLVFASQALAATPEPAWQLTGAGGPTNVAPGTKEEGSGGPRLFVAATNIGGAPTSGTAMLEVTLPAGVTAKSIGGETEDPEASAPVCVEGPPQTITCEASGPVYPGRWIGVQIPLEVASVPPQALSTEVSISGGGATTVSQTIPTEISPLAASFDFLPGRAGLDVMSTNADGSPATQAGSHPHQLTLTQGFPVQKVEGVLIPAGYLRDVRVDLPRGLIVNPDAAPALCTAAQLNAEAQPAPGREERCPVDSQVGTVSLMTTTGGIDYFAAPFFRMVPPPGVPAMFAFTAGGIGIFVNLAGEVRSDGDYGLSAVAKDVFAPATSPIFSVQTQLWGDPSSSSHDWMRGDCLTQGGTCEVDPQDTALLTMPTHCTGPISTKISIKTWDDPGVFHKRDAESVDLEGNPVGVEGCNQLAFEPTISSKPTTNLADSPSGLDFNLHQPQNTDLEGLSTAALKDAVVTLPEGLVANPSQADGLGACDSDQIGLKIEGGETHFSKDPDSCPDAAKLGTVEVTTPLLEHSLPGSVYLAKPFDNPFGSLLAIYLSIDDPKSGTIAKLAGEVLPDPVTGQLSTRFTENPQLPLEDVELHLFSGPRAPLRTPPTCDSDPSTPAQDPHTTTSDLTPWSAPEGANANPSDSFAITTAPGGGGCPASADKAPNKPSFSAGTITPQAGTYSPFVLKIAREDATQPISGVEGTLPPGLTGKLAGIPYCPEAAIAQAKARSNPNEGALEQSNPSCPAASEVGTVDVAAGAGPTPLHVQGHVYLTGPYKGAPLSIAIITPAIAGPFDLGVVVVRTALYLNSKTAQIKAISDPLPTILEGIPLDLRSASLKMGRPQFTLNPTSCDPMAIEATTTSVFNQPAALSSPFQVGGCKALPFKPKISIRLKGKTKRGGHPAITAVARFRAGDANVKRAAVTLPRSAFLDQAHIRTVCTRVQFAAKECPPGAIYGHARAFTPLLDKPLEGPVYLRSSDHELPDLVAALSGQVDFELVGRVDAIKGGIRNTFEATPDAPVSKFVLTMQGGRKGLLINSANLCKLKASARRATALLDAHNGKTHDFRPVVQNSCGKKAAKGRNQKRPKRSG